MHSFFLSLFCIFPHPRSTSAWWYNTKSLQEAVTAWCTDPSSAEAEHGHISHWDTSGVEDMSSLFERSDWGGHCSTATTFDDDISRWDVSGVRSMRKMFHGASSFNGNISQWDTSRVKDLTDMFRAATAFNGDISKWIVSEATDMQGMFYYALSFNCDISRWQISGVKNLKWMFFHAESFDRDLDNWDVSQVTNFEGVFYGAHSFDSNVNSWDVSNARNMKEMFRGASSFNKDLNHWNVSRVRTMRYMFYSASRFNKDISTWDVSSVKDMMKMFGDTRDFNQDLSAWRLVTVTDMRYMFERALAFNQVLCWTIPDTVLTDNMFHLSAVGAGLTNACPSTAPTSSPKPSVSAEPSAVPTLEPSPEPTIPSPLPTPQPTLAPTPEPSTSTHRPSIERNHPEDVNNGLNDDPTDVADEGLPLSFNVSVMLQTDRGAISEFEENTMVAIIAEQIDVDIADISELFVAILNTTQEGDGVDSDARGNVNMDLLYRLRNLVDASLPFVWSVDFIISVQLSSTGFDDLVSLESNIVDTLVSVSFEAALQAALGFLVLVDSVRVGSVTSEKGPVNGGGRGGGGGEQELGRASLNAIIALSIFFFVGICGGIIQSNRNILRVQKAEKEEEEENLRRNPISVSVDVDGLCNDDDENNLL